jgi:asparagine synthetase B (glutamine-hydrolysing)
VVEDALDVRHPFLYRPLVEFALRLPPALCIRPHQHKWVLREAMRDILPEVVRTRIGKGSPIDVGVWSFSALRSALEPLVRESILADLGIVDAVKLRRALDETPREAYSITQQHISVFATLAVEAWLQARSGRWPREGLPEVKEVTQLVN